MWVFPRGTDGLCAGLQMWHSRYLVSTMLAVEAFLDELKLFRACSRGCRTLVTTQFRHMKERPKIVEVARRSVPTFALQLVLFDAALVAWTLQRIAPAVPFVPDLRRLDLEACHMIFPRSCQELARLAMTSRSSWRLLHIMRTNLWNVVATEHPLAERAIIAVCSRFLFLLH